MLNLLLVVFFFFFFIGTTMETIAIRLTLIKKITRCGSNSCNSVVHAIYVTDNLCDFRRNCGDQRNRRPIYPLSTSLVGKKALSLPTVDNLPGNAHIKSGMCFPHLNVENIIRKYILATSTLVYFSREYNISRKNIKYYSSKLKYNHTIVSTHGKSPTNFFLESGFASR